MRIGAGEPSKFARCSQYPHCLCGSGKVICYSSKRTFVKEGETHIDLKGGGDGGGKAFGKNYKKKLEVEI